MTDDLVIIGGGIGGCISALTVLESEPDRDVRLIVTAPDRFDYHDGLIEVFGYHQPDTAQAGDSGDPSESVSPGEVPDAERSDDGETEPERDDGEEVETGDDEEPDPDYHEPTSGDAERLIPVSDPFEAVEAAPSDHPYSLVGIDALRNGLAVFDTALGSFYRGETTDQNAVFLTGGATLKPACRYPTTMEHGRLGSKEPMLLVGIEALPDFDPQFLTDRLADQMPSSVDFCTLEFPVEIPEYPAAPTIASVLDGGPAGSESPVRADDADQPTPDGVCGDENADGAGPDETDETREANEQSEAAEQPEPDEQLNTNEGTGPADQHETEAPESTTEPILESIIDSVRDELEFQRRVGFPAVLGACANDQLVRTLESRLTARVFEVPIGSPSIPGRRLQARLLAAVSKAGGTIEYEDLPAEMERDGERVEQVSFGESTYEAAEFVLATGDLRAGGLRATQSAIAEPIFGGTVSQPDERSEWFASDFSGEHPGLLAGVQVDEQLRPVDEATDVLYENVRAVGSLIDGFDPYHEGSADGVAIATGFAAGQRVLDGFRS